uniref:Uncharacterized protein n=1 Tax=Oryza brachyantha TaxID=4533 RepID=J3M925_ORYBR
MGEDRQTGHDALRRSHASRHMRWNLCLHSGIMRCISPSLYSQRQIEHAASASAPAAAEGHLRIRGDHCGVEPDGRRRHPAPRAAGRGARGVGVVRNEDDARDGDGDVPGAGRGGHGVARGVDPAAAGHAAAEAEVGGEEQRREEDEEAERDGDGVPDADRGE